MLHFSAGFAGGYLVFGINGIGVGERVRVVDAGGREVKVKGLRVDGGACGGGAGSRKDSVFDSGGVEVDVPSEMLQDASKGRSKGKGKGKGKGKVSDGLVTGARIEFASSAEKTEFLELVAEYQKPERLV